MLELQGMHAQTQSLAGGYEAAPKRAIVEETWTQAKAEFVDLRVSVVLSSDEDMCTCFQYACTRGVRQAHSRVCNSCVVDANSKFFE